MDKNLACLHPNPGWHQENVFDLTNEFQQSTSDIVGKHCILELYACDQWKLNDESFIRTILTTAAKLSGATLLNLITHHFEPQGITGLALLAESHISIHTWPESGYAAVDVFTCGEHTDPEKACEVIFKELGAKRHSLKNLKREAPSCVKDTSRSPVKN